eukprot:TRINITY_DN29219_c0_g2_i1.p1 TRINITY_DN29219_c0_g2~~TRINITY_DN29219_c0_g2_i1.p1  ORF type:complete len:944 (-),score=200.85 TRINITY_DN29219_c0_g2_i1:184-2610(-)
MGVDVPPELLECPDESKVRPPCVMCEETIAGKCGSIMGKSPVCLACAESVQSLIKSLQDMANAGDAEGARKIANELAEKGFEIPPQILEEGIVVPKCALCTQAISGKYAQVGDAMICEGCGGDLGARFQEIAELAQNGDVVAANERAKGLTAKGLELPQALLDLLDAVSKAPCCLACCKAIRGKYAPLGDKFICFDCGQAMNEGVMKAKALLEKGDSEGAASVARELKAQGLPLPDALTQSLPAVAASAPIAAPALKEDTPKAAPTAALAPAEEAGADIAVQKKEEEKPPADDAPAEAPAKAPSATAKAKAKAAEPAGSGRNAAKALAKGAAKAAPKGAAKAAPKASVAASAVPQRVAKCVIGAGKSDSKLTAADVFVRIRPLAEAGGHAEDGTVHAKILEKWDEESVTIGTQYMFSKGEAQYTFPRRVFGPDCSQQEVYDVIAPELVEAFTQRNGYNILFFAYGQTGTGKTHTMFGSPESLNSAAFHEGWGIFPRVCSLAFEMLNARTGMQFVLTASAIEFHMGMCNDLLGQHGMVEIDLATHEPSGQTWVVIEKPEDLMPFLNEVIKNRTTRTTKMNEGSSRSHAALILDLMQVDEASKEFVKTTFTLVDLAGAERPEKTGETRMTGGMCMEFLPKLMELRMSGEISEEKFKSLIPVGCQGLCINHELFSLGVEVGKATDLHTKGKPYFPPKTLIPAVIKFLGAILDGKAILTMCVCLSSAGRNAWETWFSLQYGTDLAKLRAPVKAQSPQDFEKLCKTAEAAAAKSAAEFAKAQMNKYYLARKNKAEHTADTVKRLNTLKAKLSL